MVDSVFGVLAEVARQVPMLIVEQNTERVHDLAQRAYVLVKGEAVLAGTAADLSDRDALMARYLGQARSLDH